MLSTIRTAFAATAAAAVVMTASSFAAQAGQTDFTIYNDSYSDIHYVFVSPDTSDNWGDDVLGHDILLAGYGADIDMTAFGNHCVFDVQIANEFGEVIEFWGVDFCSTSEIVVY